MLENGRPMGLKLRAKGWLERAAGNTVWIGHATPRRQLTELLARLRPLQSSRGLVRIGPPGDGGYLMPDDLDGVIAAISPGVSTESGFDQAIAERGIDVYMADASVDGPALAHPRFHFDKLFLGPVTRGNTITIADFCAKVQHFDDGGDLIMQMDIEGAEYPVLQGMSAELIARFRIIVLELHALDNLFHGFSFDLITAMLDKLLESHAVVHLHPNNCTALAVAQGIAIPPVMEMTLYRRDRTTFTHDPGRPAPHPLDADNVAGNPSIVLPACWR